MYVFGTTFAVGEKSLCFGTVHSVCLKISRMKSYVLHSRMGEITTGNIF